MLSDELLDVFTENQSIIGFALHIDFDDGEDLRAHTGVGQIVFDDNVWYGVGTLGNIGAVQSVSDGSVASTQCTLAGLKGDMIQQALESNLRGRDATLYALAFEQGSYKLLFAEILLVGMVSDYNVVMGTENTVSVTISDEFEKFNKPKNRYWTHESWVLDHPDSTLCLYASPTSDRETMWGSKEDGPQMNRT